MQIGRKMTELEAFELLSVVLEHPVAYVSRRYGNISATVYGEKVLLFENIKL